MLGGVVLVRAGPGSTLLQPLLNVVAAAAKSVAVDGLPAEA